MRSTTIHPLRQPHRKQNALSRFSALEVIGHRGDFYRQVENTLAGFQSAFAAGADGIETDVLTTKDGELVLFHNYELAPDEFFKLPARKKPSTVDQYTLDELNKASFDADQFVAGLSARAGQSMHLHLAKPPAIPTLDDLFRMLPAGKKLYLELKPSTLWSAPEDAMERKVVQKIREYKLEDRVLIISFNLKRLWRIKRLAPELKTGLDLEPSYAPWFNHPWGIKLLKHLLKLDTWLPAFENTSPQLVTRCHREKLNVVPWVWKATMGEEQHAVQKMAAWGVDGLITNQPGFLRSQLPATHSPLL